MGSASATAPYPAPRLVPQPEPTVALRSLADCAELARKKSDLHLLFMIEHQMRLVNFEPGRIEFQLTEKADPDLAGKLGRMLSEWTGMRWIVSVSRTQITILKVSAAGRRSCYRFNPFWARLLVREEDDVLARLRARIR